MAHNPVFLSPVKFCVKSESISVKFPSLIVAISMVDTQRISFPSAIQFVVEKSDFN